MADSGTTHKKTWKWCWGRFTSVEVVNGIIGADMSLLFTWLGDANWRREILSMYEREGGFSIHFGVSCMRGVAPFVSFLITGLQSEQNKEYIYVPICDFCDVFIRVRSRPCLSIPDKARSVS